MAEMVEGEKGEKVANDEAGEKARALGIDQPLASDLPSQPEVEKIRSRINISQGRIRSKTIAGKRLTREERRLAQLIVYPGDIDRPLTRSECQSLPRPCPYVSCAHHLYLDVNPSSGAIKLNFPHLEVWEMKETCALDVADRGGITLEEVGEILNLTRERIRQVEVRGLGKMRDETEEGNEIRADPSSAPPASD
jgi:hypothetical protein